MLPFGIGFSEVMLILVVTLLVVGPKKLPEIAKTVGKGIRTLRRAGAELRDAIELEEIRRTVQEPVREMRQAVTDWTDPYKDIESKEPKPDPPVGEGSPPAPAQPSETVAAETQTPSSLGDDPQTPSSLGDDPQTPEGGSHRATAEQRPPPPGSAEESAESPKPAFAPPPGVVAQGDDIEDAEIIEEPSAAPVVKSEDPGGQQNS